MWITCLFPPNRKTADNCTGKIAEPNLVQAYWNKATILDNIPNYAKTRKEIQTPLLNERLVQKSKEIRLDKQAHLQRWHRNWNCSDISYAHPSYFSECKRSPSPTHRAKTLIQTWCKRTNSLPAMSWPNTREVIFLGKPKMMRKPKKSKEKPQPQNQPKNETQTRSAWNLVLWESCFWL